MQFPPIKYFRQLLRIILLFFIIAPIFAEQLPIKTFSAADGLASSVIHHIARDSQGFLWFCARGGLSRFDGSEFTSYKIGDESSPIVQFFLETRDGKYWIVTDSGIYRVEKQAKTEVKPITDALKSNVRQLNAKKVANVTGFALFEDSTGRFWLGSQGGLFLIENRNGEQIDLKKVEFSPTAQSEKRDAIHSFAESADGSLWLLCNGGAMRLLPDGRWVEYPLPKISEYEGAFSIRIDSNGRIWLSHTTGVFILQPETFADFQIADKRIIRSLPIEEQEVNIIGTIKMPNRTKIVRLKFKSENETNNAGRAVDSGIQDIYPTADGKMWIPSTKSLYSFENEKYLRLQDTNSLPGKSTRIIEDLWGNLWFGTNGGVARFAQNGLTTYNQAGGLTEPVIHSIQETSDGKLLVIHGTWLTSIITAEGITTTRLNLPADNRFIWTANPVLLDRTNAIWSLSDKGLYRFSTFESVTQLAEKSPQKVVNSLLQKDFWYRAFNDKNGNIWFATRNKTENNFLYKYNLKTGEWTDYTNIEGFPKGKPVASFAEDKAGNLWFGFYGTEGLVRFANGRFKEFLPTDGLPSGAILALHVDAKSRLWISSTEQGLSRVDNPTAEKPEFNHLTEAHGLASDNVRCLAEDADGNIYAGTVRGLSRISPETGQIKNLTTVDGLAADFVHTAFRDSRGAIWFGTANGLSKFEPKKDILPPVPQVFISDLQIAGTNYSVSEFGQKEVDGIEVGSAENNLQINFFGIGNAKDLRYQYKLNDQDWSAPSEQRSVNFGNLAPNSYRFLVRAVNNVGVSGENPAVINFKINPPFYRTWWFITLSLLMLASSVFVLDRYRVRKTRQVENALEETKRANVIIRESEIRFRTLADTAAETILTIDTDSNIVFVNQSIEKTFGYKPEEIIGKPLTILMPERMRDGHNNGINRYLSINKKKVNWAGMPLPGLHKNGHEIPLEVSFGEFEREGKRYFTGIARDISERKRAEAELQEAREEKFRELERVRTRIATDLHDDIGSSLTQIAVLSEVARGQASQLEAENLSTPLERIKGVSKELVSVMSDIVWAINPNKDTLPDLIQRMRRFASDVLSGNGIRFEFHTPEVAENFQIGANIRREVFAIFKEAINNTVKYSECSTVKIDFQIENNWLVLQIEDNGKGFDTIEILSDDFKPEIGGNGLINMRRRAKDLGGVCEFFSELNKGTKINLNVPLHHLENKI